MWTFWLGGSVVAVVKTGSGREALGERKLHSRNGSCKRVFKHFPLLFAENPEHVSGHSTFSAAAAEVLQRFTGNDAFGATYTKPARSMAAQTSTSWAMPPPMVAMATQMVASAGTWTQKVASGTSMAMLTILSSTGA